MAFGYCVYYTERSTSRVMAWNPDTDETKVIIDESITDAQGTSLDGPYGLIFNQSDELFIADKLNHRICQLVDGKLGVIKTHSQDPLRKCKIPKYENSPMTPTGLCLDVEGAILCSYCDENTIYRIYPDGRLELVLGIAPGRHYKFRGLVDRISSDDVCDTPVYMPTSLAYRASDRTLFFIERGFSCVREYQPERGMTLISALGGKGKGQARCPSFSKSIPLADYSLGHPSALAVGSDGSLFISDAMMNCVIRVDLDALEVHLAWKRYDTGRELPGGHLPLAMGADGTLWIIDTLQGSLEGIALDGKGTVVASKTVNTSCDANEMDWAGLCCSV